MRLAPLVALYSPAPGSGKSTTAFALRQRGWEVVKFAGPLKAMMAALLSEAGARSDAIGRMLEGDLKEAPTGMLDGRTPRHAMQTLGTEWGRACIGETFWINLAMLRAHAIRSLGVPVVIDDCRFLNEAEAIRAARGHVFEIRRDGIESGTTHASEGALAGFAFDMVIRNTDCLAAGWGARSAGIISGQVMAWENAQ